MAAAGSSSRPASIPLARAAEIQLGGSTGCALMTAYGAIKNSAQLREGQTAYVATGLRLGLGTFRRLLAEGQAQLGALADALGTVEDALGAAPEEVGKPDLHRLRGDLLARQGAEASAVEASYREAMDLARRQGAKAVELRATTSFGRWLQAQGRAAEARDLLAPIYGWFTEGFDTRDLREAKALLEELG